MNNKKQYWDYDNIENFNLSEFSGPLDLLLKLVRDKKIDLMEIKLVDLMDQYLVMLESLIKNNINIAGEYLVIASYFIKLKSRLLLPNISDEDIDIEEFERLEKMKLIARLNEYHRYNQLIPPLLKKFESGKKFLAKSSTDISFLNDYYEKNMKYLNDYTNYSDLNINLLYEMMNELWLKNQNKNKEMIITLDEIDPEEQKKMVLEMLINNKKISLFQICSGYSVRYFLVTFITILEMCMKGIIKIKKSANNKDIIIFST